MSVPDNPPAPILVLPHEIQQQAKTRRQQNLSQLVKKLSGTVFYGDSPSRSSMRSSLGTSPPGKSVDTPDTGELICQKFTRNVSFTTYNDYYPYISRLLGDNCRASEIEYPLAPGVPNFVTIPLEPPARYSNTFQSMPITSTLIDLAGKATATGVLPDFPDLPDDRRI
ncbi:hypothetical protein D9619_007483 [Psilocybe cf. subviscida]|uniref:Uncharacterized protein n=1 Tax=Psilocybe cf. subviscida TaxID=2480587 RepID=A0A8H5B3H8_9AGAR|nr:hypothetical protein D9619_007483 [Psilocybe cf. subviscida]